MPFVGDKGAASFPVIRRVDLITGEQWMRERRGYRPPSPAGSAGIGGSRTQSRPGSGSPREWNDSLSRFAHEARHWTDELVRTPAGVWTNSGMLEISSGPNKYGFLSRSEMNYPELYRPIDTKFWKPLTAEERRELVARAAAANAKATFEDEEVYRPVAATNADEQYLEAQSRRAESLRRRRKPRNYDERKQDEELRRKEPLVRKYTGPVEQFFRQTSAIVKEGPIDTPVLVTGLPVFGQNDHDATAPQQLKAKRRMRRPQAEGQLTRDDGDQLVGLEGELPTFSPLAGKKTALVNFTNNPWGLKSWSEMLYPEAYRDISNVYWKQLSDADRNRIMAVQARAMEKVGYEPGTAKYFIEPIEFDDDYRLARGGRTDDTAGPQHTSSAEGFIALLVVLAILAALLWAAGGAFQNANNTATSAPVSTGVSDTDGE